MANVSGHSAADDSGVEEDAQASQGAEELNSDAPNADMQTELERLRRVVAQWNASRLDLFEISEPNEDLTFHGVMRFFYQEAGSKVATKCVRVASTAAGPEVVEALFEKFRPDMKMLTTAEEYCLIEVRVNGDERILDDAEIPLLVQLNWHKDDLEGRFYLRRRGAPGPAAAAAVTDGAKERGIFKRFSRRMAGGRRGRSNERRGSVPGDNNVDAAASAAGSRKRSSSLSKLTVKNQRLNKKRKGSSGSTSNATGDARRGSTSSDGTGPGADSSSDAEMVSSTFTRSLSNPEAVMRRRRQQKLVQKLKDYKGKEGEPDSGGALKVFGDLISPTVPYKTILCAVGDTSSHIVDQSLEKYNLSHICKCEDFALVVRTTSKHANVMSNGMRSNEQRLVADDEMPLLLSRELQTEQNEVTFHLVAKNDARHGAQNIRPRVEGTGEDLIGRSLQQLPWHTDPQPVRTDLRQGARAATEPSSPKLGQQRRLVSSTQALHHPVETYATVSRDRTDSTAEREQPAGRPVRRTSSLGALTVKKQQLQMRINKKGSSTEHTPELPRRRYLSESPGNMPGSRTSSGSSSATGAVQTVGQASSAGANYTTIASPSAGGGLPCTLIVSRSRDDPLIRAVVRDSAPKELSFKAAPSFVFYLALKCIARRPPGPNNTKEQAVCGFLDKAVTTIDMFLEDCGGDIEIPIMWLANGSQLYHFLSHDVALSAVTSDRLRVLWQTVLFATSKVLDAFCNILVGELPVFLSDSPLVTSPGGRRFTNTSISMQEVEQDIDGVLSTFHRIRRVLTEYHVHSVLVEAIFSQMFHFSSAWLFNQLVQAGASPDETNPDADDAQPSLCCRRIGFVLKQRLSVLAEWAGRNGVGRIAERHLLKIIQAASFLASPKSRPEFAAVISGNCYEINSVQIACLVRLYRCDDGEAEILPALVSQLLLMAENTVDEMLHSSGMEVQLQEVEQLSLKIAPPEEGFLSEKITGVPQGLEELLQKLGAAGVCEYATSSSSSWQPWTTVPALTSASAAQEPDRSNAATPLADSNIAGDCTAPPSRAGTGQERVEKSPQPTAAAAESGENGADLTYATVETIDGVGERTRPDSASKVETHTEAVPRKQHEAPAERPAVKLREKRTQKPRTIALDGLELSVVTVTIDKAGGGIGISIVGGRGSEEAVGDDGIYINTVLPGGAADRVGVLDDGDQILYIDDQSLLGHVTQERAADVVRSTGQLVAITVAKKSFQLKRERRQAKLFEQERLQAQQRARDIAEGRGYEDDGITTDEERVKNLARERRRSRDHRRTGGGGGGGGGGGNGSGSAVQGRFNPEPYEEVSVSNQYDTIDGPSVRGVAVRDHQATGAGPYDLVGSNVEQGGYDKEIRVSVISTLDADDNDGYAGIAGGKDGDMNRERELSVARGEVVALRETDASDAQRPSTPRNDSSKATTPTSGVMGQLTPSKIGAASSSPAQPRGTNSGVKTNGGKKVDSTELIAEMLNYSPITINPRLRTESGSSSENTPRARHRKRANHSQLLAVNETGHGRGGVGDTTTDSESAVSRDSRNFTGNASGGGGLSSLRAAHKTPSGSSEQVPTGGDKPQLMKWLLEQQERSGQEQRRAGGQGLHAQTQSAAPLRSPSEDGVYNMDEANSHSVSSNRVTRGNRPASTDYSEVMASTDYTSENDSSVAPSSVPSTPVAGALSPNPPSSYAATSNATTPTSAGFMSPNQPREYWADEDEGTLATVLTGPASFPYAAYENKMKESREQQVPTTSTTAQTGLRAFAAVPASTHTRATGIGKFSAAPELQISPTSSSSTDAWYSDQSSPTRKFPKKAPLPAPKPKRAPPAAPAIKQTNSNEAVPLRNLEVTDGSIPSLRVLTSTHLSGTTPMSSTSTSGYASNARSPQSTLGKRKPPPPRRHVSLSTSSSQGSTMPSSPMATDNGQKMPDAGGSISPRGDVAGVVQHQPSSSAQGGRAVGGQLSGFAHGQFPSSSSSMSSQADPPTPHQFSARDTSSSNASSRRGSQPHITPHTSQTNLEVRPHQVLSPNAPKGGSKFSFESPVKQLQSPQSVKHIASVLHSPFGNGASLPGVGMSVSQGPLPLQPSGQSNTPANYQQQDNRVILNSLQAPITGRSLSPQSAIPPHHPTLTSRSPGSSTTTSTATPMNHLTQPASGQRLQNGAAPAPTGPVGISARMATTTSPAVLPPGGLPGNAQQQQQQQNRIGPPYGQRQQPAQVSHAGPLPAPSQSPDNRHGYAGHLAQGRAGPAPQAQAVNSAVVSHQQQQQHQPQQRSQHFSLHQQQQLPPNMPPSSSNRYGSGAAQSGPLHRLAAPGFPPTASPAQGTRSGTASPSSYGGQPGYGNGMQAARQSPQRQQQNSYQKPRTPSYGQQLTGSVASRPLHNSPHSSPQHTLPGASRMGGAMRAPGPGMATPPQQLQQQQQPGMKAPGAGVRRYEMDMMREASTSQNRKKPQDRSSMQTATPPPGTATKTTPPMNTLHAPPPARQSHHAGYASPPVGRQPSAAAPSQGRGANPIMPRNPQQAGPRQQYWSPGAQQAAKQHTQSPNYGLV